MRRGPGRLHGPLRAKFVAEAFCERVTSSRTRPKLLYYCTASGREVDFASEEDGVVLTQPAVGRRIILTGVAFGGRRSPGLPEDLITGSESAIEDRRLFCVAG
ncbi:MAG: hypothetical protein ACYTFA_14535 [Planctomycetota bacterium]|jgi:hypothetical protein